MFRLIVKEEVWRPVKGYEEYYQVSNFGRVKSLNWDGTGVERIMTPCKGKRGYMQVLFNRNGIRATKTVHRLVAEAFIPNPNNFPYINHKNEDKTINFLWNLEWCTAKYNSNYGTCVERSRDTRIKIGNYWNHNCRRKVIRYNEYSEVEYESISEAAKQNKCSESAIGSCVRGKTKTSCGYKWKYV